MDGPIRVFIGTEEAQALPTAVLRHSILSRTRSAVEFHDLASLGLGIEDRAYTGFSFYRWAIPKLCGFEGRAIYVDADIVFGCDVAELWNLPMGEHSHLARPRPERDEHFTSVMLLDCARLTSWRFDDWVARAKTDEAFYRATMWCGASGPTRAGVGPLPAPFNHLDEHVPDVTKVIHYTKLRDQPWKRPGHPHEKVFLDALRAAIDAGATSRAAVDDAVRAGHAHPGLPALLDGVSTPTRAGPFSFGDSRFAYEPYPIGIARDVLPTAAYDELSALWPPTELFEFKEKLGRKYSLSKVNHPEAYRRFVAEHEPWRRFRAQVEAPEFAEAVLAMLARHGIDLGLVKQPRDGEGKGLARAWRTWSARRRRGLTTRFEFSMLPADGGSIKPHTDSPGKVVTLVVSMQRAGEWDPAWGGATDVLRAKDATKSFNHVNRQLEFGDVEPIGAFPYAPNQCVIFVKTFNSLHAVHPMRGPSTAPMRRTLTINIERRS